MDKTITAMVELSKSEVAERSTQLAELLKEVETQKEELKDHAKAERDQIKVKEQDVVRLREAVRRKKEYRDVEVSEMVEGQNIVTIRKDTGEVVETRRATPGELQSPLFAVP